MLRRPKFPGWSITAIISCCNELIKHEKWKNTYIVWLRYKSVNKPRNLTVFNTASLTYSFINQDNRDKQYMLNHNQIQHSLPNTYSIIAEYILLWCYKLNWWHSEATLKDMGKFIKWTQYEHLWDVLYRQVEMPSERTHNAIITSLLRPNDVTTSFERNDDVNIALCVRWDTIFSPHELQWVWHERPYYRLKYGD